MKNVPEAEEALDDEVEADDWGSGEPSTADINNEQQQPVDSSSADSDYGSHILDVETECASSLFTIITYPVSLLRLKFVLERN